MPSKSKNGSGSFRTYRRSWCCRAEIPLKVKVPLDHVPWGPRVLQLVLHLVLHLDTIIQFHCIHVVIPQARVLSQSIPTRRIGGAARVNRTSL